MHCKINFISHLYSKREGIHRKVFKVIEPITMQNQAQSLCFTPISIKHHVVQRRAARHIVAAMPSDQNMASFPTSCSRSVMVVSLTHISHHITPQMDTAKNVLRNTLMSAAAASLLLTGTALAPPSTDPTHLTPAPAHAGMLSADPVKNARALLRYALPINNKPIRDIQRSLEQISEDLRVPGSKSLGNVSRRVRAASSVLERESKTILADLAPDRKAEGSAALDKLRTGLNEFQGIIDAQDKQIVPIKQQELLTYVGQVEESMVKGFPFEIPAQYANLPQLKGRATVEMEIKFSDPREDNSTGGKMIIVADGYNAPLSAGDFIDLVRRGFYDGMDIQRADGFVVQTGKPSGDAEGLVVNGEVRRIPFEVMVQGDKVPVYEETLEDNGRYYEQPVLPFNAFGTMALARAEFEANSASSQFFFLLKESELTPTGSNLLDGRYAVFGYVTQGADLLKEVQVGDTIKYAKVTEGLENLKYTS